ncbi:hypothetical protein RRG08_034685 [Elysia crispata]|uniref:Uncharacterized protein n=1 Tax=Elysia crispata TaxID=231223 RepID=A0AAE0Z2U3_9GAST|nr:hypothetical protein RRG08_034685 [Elysia crispata]
MCSACRARLLSLGKTVFAAQKLFVSPLCVKEAFVQRDFGQWRQLRRERSTPNDTVTQYLGESRVQPDTACAMQRSRPGRLSADKNSRVSSQQERAGQAVFDKYDIYGDKKSCRNMCSLTLNIKGGLPCRATVSRICSCLMG